MEVHEVERWLAARRRAVLTILVVAAVIIRLFYFLELNRGPCIWQHRWPDSDMNFFDAWARDIAAGDWLSDRSFHPRHSWYGEVAAAYLADHPDEAQALAQGGQEPAVALWDRWYGGKRFHQEPLYPYLVALTYRLLGADVRWVFAWQMLLGVLTIVLVHRLARRYFGELAAAVAGTLAVLCGPLLLYELVLIRTTLLAFTGLALVELTEVALERRSVVRWLAVGLAFGFALLLQASFLLLLVCALAVLLRREWPRFLAPAGAFVAGVGLALLPAVARNVAVDVPPLSLTTVTPVVFVLSNTAGYDPSTGFAVNTSEVARIMGTTDGRLLPVVRETLATHSGLASWLSQLWGKFAVTWHWYERPNNTNFYYYRLHSVVLTYLPITFTVLSPLILVGLVLAAPHAAHCAMLYALVATTMAPLLVFYVLSRFRVLVGVAGLPFAAVPVVELVRWLSSRRFVPAGATVVALLALGAWAGRPMPEGKPLIRVADYAAAYYAYYGPETAAAFDRGDWPRAIAVLADAVAHEPESVRGPSPLANADDARFYGMVHLRYAQALGHVGDTGRSMAQMQRARELLAAGGVQLPES
jgi:4-amino-4-deoxy-L-arabinose transferase-like glycosyltransferase